MRNNLNIKISRHLVLDGVRYIPHEFKDEAELESKVFANFRHIFGEGTLLLRKSKINTVLGEGTIPDGFVLDITNKKWFVVEVELSTHPFYDHIFSQVGKFTGSLKNPNTRIELVKRFDEEVESNKEMQLVFWKSGVEVERYKFISRVLDSEPTIVIIIDKKKHNMETELSALNYQKVVLEFKMYTREKVGTEIAIFDFDSLVSSKDTITPEKIIPEVTKSPTLENESISLIEVIPTPGSKNEFNALIFPNSDTLAITTWRSILVQTINWLVNNSKLRPENYRSLLGNRDISNYLRLSGSNYSRDFFAPRIIGPFELEANHDQKYILRLAVSFLEACGVDPSSVKLVKN